MKSLYDKLAEYSQAGYVPMHMPGHKRNTGLMKNRIAATDITEIDGFDNLHHPEGIILDEMRRAAYGYGSRKTWFMVNGSSIGLMSAIMALTHRRDKIIVARNCHVSVYNAIVQNELEPVYIYPESVDNLGITRGINPKDIENKLIEHSVHNVDNSVDCEIKAIVITSPTYEGFVSDVKSISMIAHRYNVPLIVDEAHGAHFMFDDAFPESALSDGADVVVQSLHKTLPSYTQTAVVHLGRNALKPDEYEYKLNAYIDIFQSTSPSYILMGSISHCLSFMFSEAGKIAVRDYVVRLNELRRKISSLKNIHMEDTDDISKIVLFTVNSCLQGKQLYDILLHKYRIQLEMASLRYVIAMTSVGDTDEYYDRFFEALQEIDSDPVMSSKDVVQSQVISSDGQDTVHAAVSCHNELVYIPAEMFCRDCSDSELVEADKADGRICAEKVVVYPPGIPVVMPGERINKDVVQCITESIDNRLEVIGVTEGKFRCLR